MARAHPHTVRKNSPRYSFHSAVARLRKLRNYIGITALRNYVIFVIVPRLKEIILYGTCTLGRAGVLSTAAKWVERSGGRGSSSRDAITNIT